MARMSQWVVSKARTEHCSHDFPQCDWAHLLLLTFALLGCKTFHQHGSASAVPKAFIRPVPGMNESHQLLFLLLLVIMEWGRDLSESIISASLLQRYMWHSLFPLWFTMSYHSFCLHMGLSWSLLSSGSVASLLLCYTVPITSHMVNLWASGKASSPLSSWVVLAIVGLLFFHINFRQWLELH
jgi:hypothetical protein